MDKLYVCHGCEKQCKLKINKFIVPTKCIAFESRTAKWMKE